MSIRYPDLDFTFLIFQANPHKDLLYFWLDGDKVKRTMMIEAFMEMVKSKQPELVGDIHNAAITYSFYLWSIPDKSVTHLYPNAEETPYPDSLNNLMFGKKPHIVVKKQTIEEMLNQYGFNAPSPENIQNLRVNLEKRPENEGFLARFFNRQRGPTQTIPKDIVKTK